VYFKDLPSAFDGFTITQLSDIHSGSFRDPEAVRRGVELVNAQRSDLFVFTGDLVNSLAAEFEPWISVFRQIEAPFGTYSILGNHDYGDYHQWDDEQDKQRNFEALKAHHATVGFRLLLDEHVTLEKDGEQIALLGVENWGLGFGQRGDLQKALKGLPAESFKVLLSHDPTHWDHQVKADPNPIQLTLSGHTHGMQVGVEIPGFRWSPVKYRYPKWAGLYEEAGRYLYINRGFGYLGFHGRVGIWPEITVLELRRADV
jgi:predicted MPP superfamily phosphohydrolase